jgi:ABC-2 type transport system permease protein
MRNHFPRTSAGSILIALLLSLWYALFGVVAGIGAWRIAEAPVLLLMRYLPPSLLGLTLFWQLFPLLTLSTGWSLELEKIKVYPVKHSALFAIELALRVTGSPEMFLLALGVFAGLLANPSIPAGPPFVVALFVVFNLLAQLGIRDLYLLAIGRTRIKEFAVILVLILAVTPQLLVYSGSRRVLGPWFFAVAGARFTPWEAAASFGTGSGGWLEIAVLLASIVAAYVFAWATFARTIRAEDSFSAAASLHFEREGKKRGSFRGPERVLRGPLGALVQKELQSLLRMPRVRVLLGMACFFGVIVFLPLSLGFGPNHSNQFLRDNFLTIVNLYGLLLIGEALLLNVFGLDRGAAQFYFIAPVALRTVLHAKNAAAILFVGIQNVAILMSALILRLPLTVTAVATEMLATAVVTVYLLAIGNMMSVSMPRPIDPRQTMRKQTGGKMQLWLLGSSLCVYVLVGFAFLARWAFHGSAGLFAILGLELGVGMVVYWIALDSAVERATRSREQIVDNLTRSGSPVMAG